VISLDLTRLCPPETADYYRPTRSTVAAPLDSGDHIVGAWVNAGRRVGLYLGAAFGGTVTVIGGIGEFVILGTLVGAALGALFGLVLGAANGLVLAWLAKTRLLLNTAGHRARTATVVAVLTTAVTGLGLPLAIYRALPTHGAGIALFYAPLTMGVVIAAALSRRLPPGQRRVRAMSSRDEVRLRR
jgi:hypothetical protein